VFLGCPSGRPVSIVSVRPLTPLSGISVARIFSRAALFPQKVDDLFCSRRS